MEIEQFPFYVAKLAYNCLQKVNVYKIGRQNLMQKKTCRLYINKYLYLFSVAKKKYDFSYRFQQVPIKVTVGGRWVGVADVPASRPPGGDAQKPP